MKFKLYNAYVFTGLVILSAVYLVAYNGLIYAGLEIRQVPYRLLFEYQATKARKTNASIVFVGDSSLGNAINGTLFSSLSGKNTVNLALAGRFGFKGSLSMIKAAHNKNLKTVVIMQTLDMFTRKVSPEYVVPRRVLIFRGFDDIEIDIFNFATLQTLVEACRLGNYANKHGARIISTTTDYIEQGPPNKRDQQYKKISPNQINPMKLQELIEIVNYCSSNNIDCIYAHGPIVENICENSVDYIGEVNKVIKDTGIILATKSPLCIPAKDIGDSEDHVLPSRQNKYTTDFYTVLHPYL